MFDFCPHRGFLALSALDLRLGAGGIALALGRVTIDFVMDSLAGFVFDHGFGTFFSAQISAVTIDYLLLAGQQICCNAYVMRVGSRYSNVWTSPLSASTPIWALYPKCHVLPFLAEWASESRSFFRFLVEDGASMNVESTMVPFFKISPRSVRSSQPGRRVFPEVRSSAADYETCPAYRHQGPSCWTPLRRSRRRRDCPSPLPPLLCRTGCRGSVSDRF